MSKVAVVFWSQTGNTEAMANLVAEGVQAAGGEAEVIYCSDFNAGRIAEFSAFAFGCPAMGDEVLEETEFQPMWDEVKGSLSGKKVGLFGSYGWGDGQWMRDWVERCRNAGANLIGEGLILNGTPDADGEAQCFELGKQIAG